MPLRSYLIPHIIHIIDDVSPLSKIANRPFSLLPLCGSSHLRMGCSFHGKMDCLIDVLAGFLGDNVFAVGSSSTLITHTPTTGYARCRHSGSRQRSVGPSRGISARGAAPGLVFCPVDRSRKCWPICLRLSSGHRSSSSASSRRRRARLWPPVPMLSWSRAIIPPAR